MVFAVPGAVAVAVAVAVVARVPASACSDSSPRDHSDAAVVVDSSPVVAVVAAVGEDGKVPTNTLGKRSGVASVVHAENSQGVAAVRGAYDELVDEDGVEGLEGVEGMRRRSQRR